LISVGKKLEKADELEKRLKNTQHLDEKVHGAHKAAADSRADSADGGLLDDDGHRVADDSN